MHATERARRRRLDAPANERAGASPPALLALQRSAGNHAVTRMLARVKHKGAEIKSFDELAKLAPDVYATYVAQCKSRLVDEGIALGLAREAADDVLCEDGELDPSKLNAKFEEYVAVQPPEAIRKAEAKKEPAPAPAPVVRTPFNPERRAARWGALHVIAPGVGVEVLNGEDESYVKFLQDLVAIIRTTDVGRTMLDQFDPELARQLKQLTGPDTDVYKGIAVLIGLPGKDRLLKTIDVAAMLPDGTRGPTTGGAPVIPRISFFNRPRAKEERHQVGSSTAYVTQAGVEGHADFPDAVQAFDVALFHELGHAYLSARGITQHLEDTQEEKLIVGLAETRGYVLTENEYRYQRNEPIRNSYLDAKVPKDESLTRSFWEKLDKLDLVAALVKLTGWEKGKAEAIAAGKPAT